MHRGSNRVIFFFGLVIQFTLTLELTGSMGLLCKSPIIGDRSPVRASKCHLCDVLTHGKPA